MILLEKRAHLVLKTPLAVMDLLLVNVSDHRIHIRRADGEQTVSALPRERANALLLHPRRRTCLNLRDNFRRRSGRGQSHRNVDVICDSADPKAVAVQSAHSPGKIGMKSRKDVIVDECNAVFRTEDDVDQIEAQRLRHGSDYMSGLQPSSTLTNTYLGLRPRLRCHRTYGPHSFSASRTRGIARKVVMQCRMIQYISLTTAEGAIHNSLGHRPRSQRSNHARAEGPKHEVSA